MITIEEIKRISHLIEPYIRKTPIISGPYITKDIPDHLALKLEHLQVSGSFKARGIFSNLLRSSKRDNGVIVASKGNHGLAAAYAGARLGVRTIVVLPQDTPQFRIDLIQSWKAETVICGNASEAFEYAEVRAKNDDLLFIHPFREELTWLGAATLGLELVKDLSHIDCVLLAVGGGGLLSGVGSIIKDAFPRATIVAVEPANCPKLYTSLKHNALVELLPGKTFADTLSPRAVSPSTFESAKTLVDECVLVGDDELLRAMKILWRELNQVVEPSGAAALAAALRPDFKIQRFKHPVAILCGGNVDLSATWENYQQQACVTEYESASWYKMERYKNEDGGGWI
jgi:threonine dehydratase